MKTTKIIQKDYSLSSMNYQLKLPFELEVLIPDNDPVRLLSTFVEELELTDLYRSYGKIKKGHVTPRQMFKIVIYAAINLIYSSRDIETACKMAFRRYTYWGIDNVTAKSVVLAIAHNINKLHNKIQNDKTENHLFELKKTA